VKYRLSGPAKDDVWEIWGYLADHATLDVADQVAMELHKAMEKLAEVPGVGHLRTDLADKLLRFWCVRSYLIVYVAESSPLEVVRVLHGARDVRALLEEDPGA
jgi:toxin ParE1/3/4